MHAVCVDAPRRRHQVPKGRYRRSHILTNTAQTVMFSSSALERNVPAMFELWQSIFASPHLSNTSYLASLIKQHAVQCRRAFDT